MFSEHLAWIFHIIHQNPQALIKISKEWTFLINQREGRKGYMTGVDTIMKQKSELKETFKLGKARQGEQIIKLNFKIHFCIF